MRPMTKTAAQAFSAWRIVRDADGTVMSREPGEDDDDLKPATELIEALKELDRKREKERSGSESQPSPKPSLKDSGGREIR